MHVFTGADPNLNCGEGRWTCLHAATDMQTIRELLRGGGDPTLQDMYGKTAEDTHREEAERPPPPKKGQRQTAKDREIYRNLRLQMADFLNDKMSARTCDWAWKLFCPKKRTRQVTKYGVIMQDKPKRPGMIRGVADKEDIVRYYYKIYGSESQMKEVPTVLKKVLVGATEEDNWDLFKIYCDKLKSLHGKCPRELWKEHEKAVSNGEAEVYTKWDLLDGYGACPDNPTCAHPFCR